MECTEREWKKNEMNPQNASVMKTNGQHIKAAMNFQNIVLQPQKVL